MKALENAGLNVFYFPAEMISGCDMLSDSGTTTMTNKQWAMLHIGDESYGSNRGYFLLLKTVSEIFGKQFVPLKNDPKPNVFLFHQGRPAEDALFSLIGQISGNQIIPSNGHFDTTQANIEANNIKAVNLFSPELKNPLSKNHFKGDMDIDRLKVLITEKKGLIPLVYLTITNNTGGGQPVSIENIRQVSQICHKNNIPLFLDACRFAENAYFIKLFENNYSQKTIESIVLEMFSLADGFTISFKKDGLVNMGGGLFLARNGLFVKNYPKIPDKIMNHQIIKEGHPTYGGMSGRDIMALVEGLKTITDENYLSYRVNQIQQFGLKMAEMDLPVLTPIGGHAVYLDMNRFFADSHFKPQDFGGISFTAILLAAYGHRACELGNFAFGEYNPKTGEETYPEVNFVRFAIPRLRYERQDLENVTESVKAIYDNRKYLPKIKVTYGRELTLRHFKARFEFV
jgi:tryptophanase